MEKKRGRRRRDEMGRVTYARVAVRDLASTSVSLEVLAIVKKIVRSA